MFFEEAKFAPSGSTGFEVFFVTLHACTVRTSPTKIVLAVKLQLQTRLRFSLSLEFNRPNTVQNRNVPIAEYPKKSVRQLAEQASTGTVGINIIELKPAGEKITQFSVFAEKASPSPVSNLSGCLSKEVQVRTIQRISTNNKTSINLRHSSGVLQVQLYNVNTEH
jgi:hypothetical protein